MLQWHKEEVFMKWYDEIAHRN